MKRLLFFSLVTVIAISLISCSDSGTGPDSDNGGEEPTTYTVDISSSEGGSVSPSGSNEYEEGEEIEIEASANEEHVFTEWTGDVESSDNPLSLTVDQDYNLTANFKIKEYELTIDTEGEGAVQEEVLEQKSKEYEHGTVVELTANPSEGYKFVEWQGDVEGTDNPTEITVDNPKEVAAVFEKKSYELTVNSEGEGAVSEEIVQEKSKEYDHGTVVELTANPAEGYTFSEWKRDLTGSENPKQITVDEAKDITAVFEKESYALTVNIDGNGSVTKSPDQETYEYESTVVLEANPDNSHKLVEWSGAIESTDNPVELTIDSEMQLTASFDKKLFYLAENRVTVKCPDAEVGETGDINGITYTKREADQITTDNAETTCTSGIQSMYHMFKGAGSFNGDISSWDVSNVTDMEAMFREASSFNQDLNSWDISRVTTMEYMFRDASNFNGDISSWDVSSVTNMGSMFSTAGSFAGDLSSWDVGSVRDMDSMFWKASSFDGDISNWNVSSVSDMSYMFFEASSFAGDLSSWDVGNVTNMGSMFNEATSFNSDIGDWDVSSVTSMSSIFRDATSFNQDISGWCVPLIDEEPFFFSSGSLLEADYHPVWGTCPE